MAADEGHERVQNRYDMCPMNDERERDLCEAARYYKMSGDQGDANGQYNYGYCLARGDGLEEAVCEAARYFRPFKCANISKKRSLIQFLVNFRTSLLDIKCLVNKWRMKTTTMRKVLVVNRETCVPDSFEGHLTQSF